jgi:hypothetical protein
LDDPNRRFGRSRSFLFSSKKEQNRVFWNVKGLGGLRLGGSFVGGGGGFASPPPLPLKEALGARLETSFEVRRRLEIKKVTYKVKIKM